MITVRVKTSDSLVWNKDEVHAKISRAVFANQPLTIDLMNEGPAFETLGIDEYIQTLLGMVDYSSIVSIKTSNMLEKHSDYQVIKKFPQHLVKQALEYQCDINKHQLLKHFGMFVGRGNSPRLYLSSYLYNNYSNQIIHSNHLDLEKEFYAANLHLDRLVSEYTKEDLDKVANYIRLCPITQTNISPDKSLRENHAQQLLQQDKDFFLDQYNHFAIEIVGETYFSGNTFFPTEKTWRPILLKTPFIIQGPTGFLKNLRDLGFKTFRDYWDEGYDEDPYPWSVKEIIKVIDDLATRTPQQLHDMICDMQDILEHNHERFLDLANVR